MERVSDSLARPPLQIATETVLENFKPKHNIDNTVKLGVGPKTQSLHKNLAGVSLHNYSAFVQAYLSKQHAAQPTENTGLQ